MENRAINEELLKVAHDLIQTEDTLSYIRESNVQIIVLDSDSEKKSKGRIIFGQCERVPDKYRWIIPFDFTITVFTPNTERMSEAQIRILLLHELMHVGIEFDGNEEKYFLRPHDIEDFREILDRFGMDWNNEPIREAEEIRKRHRRTNVKGK